MEGPTIRAARAADLPEALRMFGELEELQRDWRVFPPRASLRAEAEARFRGALEDQDARLIVADEGGRLVGMALGSVERVSSYSDELALELSGVYVVPADRARGVGAALVGALAGFARERGIRRVVLKTFAGNRDALDFWGSLGFEPRIIQLTALAESVPSTPEIPRTADA